MSVINTRSFGRFWPVSWTITHCFGVPEWFPCLTNPVVRLRVGHQHSQFWPILACFMDYYSLFWGPGLISTSNEPCRAFTCRYQHSQFWPILTRFVDYYSPFCGPQAISKVVEPQVAVMCRSSTLAVLADSGPFRGLLLTIFGSEVISTINEP